MITTFIKNQLLKLIHLLFCLGIVSCSEAPPKEDQLSETTLLIADQTETLEQPENIEDTSADIQSDIELVIEKSEVIFDMGKELIENKRRKDSVLLSKREKMYAYQLGAPLKHEKLVIEAYQKLSDTKGVCVLKKSRKEYLLVKYENKEEDVLDYELEEYKQEHADEVIGEIKKIDLMRECGKRKKPILSGKLKKRKGKIEINCLTCDN